MATCTDDKVIGQLQRASGLVWSRQSLLCADVPGSGLASVGRSRCFIVGATIHGEGVGTRHNPATAASTPGSASSALTAGASASRGRRAHAAPAAATRRAPTDTGTLVEQAADTARLFAAGVAVELSTAASIAGLVLPELAAGQCRRLARSLAICHRLSATGIRHH